MWGGFNVFKAMKTVIFHMFAATHFIQCLSSNEKALRNGEVFLSSANSFPPVTRNCESDKNISFSEALI